MAYSTTSTYSTIQGYGSNTDFSIFTVQTHNGTAAVRSIVDQDGGVGLNRRCQYRLDAAHKTNFIAFNTIQGTAAPTCGTAVPANTPFTACGTLSGNMATVYCNNFAPVTAALTGTPVGLLATQDIYVGRKSTIAQAHDGTVALVLIYNRSITAREYAQLSANPWQVLAQSSARSLFVKLTTGVISGAFQPTAFQNNAFFTRGLFPGYGWSGISRGRSLTGSSRGRFL